MYILRNFLLLLAGIVISYLLRGPVGDFAESLPNTGSAWIDLSDLDGFLIVYIFLLPLLLSGFRYKYWHYWLLVFWVPIFILFVLTGVYLPLSLTIAGFGLGYLVHKFWPVVLKTFRK